MRIPNDPGQSGGGPWSDLLRLQSEFQARLADETLRYLRRLQGTLGPAAPGTVVMPDSSPELKGAGLPGAALELTLEVDNRQRVHCVVTPMLSPLVGGGGATWFPEADMTPPSLLVAPREAGSLVLRVKIPAELPLGSYRGSLLLHGFREGGLPVVLTIGEQPAASKPRRMRLRPPTPRAAG
ncbi:MAG: hypothetical protein JF888_09435 [Candidatus Dormibacteraeota bacterium]|uniref:Uncharacterized protein n=1 Tax=Candidatus Dormiibacter inghamiae TaxID=3127013 RepID=A0A934NDP8_9BACT|nr:hypothetical protein [Candidatus Dormibacteraeota bacterium]MBJ7606788.1 hypothetical protein [Candidatus Dormibacteraeota bacterium]